MFRLIYRSSVVEELCVVLGRNITQQNVYSLTAPIFNALLRSSRSNSAWQPSTSKSSQVENESIKSGTDVFGTLQDEYIEPSRRRKRKLRLAAVKATTSQHHSKNSNFAEDDSDQFGLLNPPSLKHIEDMPTTDVGEKLMDRYESRTPRYNKDLRYFKQKIKDFLKERKLKDALSVLTELIDEARHVPDYYTYDLLIGGCGKAGYTRMAFKLYRQMKDRRLKVNNVTYTALFNACSNSPWPEDGLKRAHGLYDEVIRKGILLNAINYHAAIKAFGRCGDLQMAFRLVDEMVRNGVGVTCETFNFLLNGCASDHQTGFLQAIRVWKKLREKKIQPDLYSYNLLLRIVRDCNLGDPETASRLLFDDPNSSHSGVYIPPGSRKQVIQETDSQSALYHQQQSHKNELTVEISPQFPDVLAPTTNSGSVVALQIAAKRQDRLYMLGGMYGLFYRMTKDNVEPNLKTFTQLLEVIPPTLKDEENLLAIMKEKGVKPDIDFFNMLIKKRSGRSNIKAVKDVLTLVAKEGLYVDIATFGSLALSCHDWGSAKQLLKDMKDAGFRPNIHIMGALVHKACTIKDFWYLIDMLKYMKTEEVEPCPKLLVELETLITDTKEFIVDQEKNGVVFSNNDNRIKSFRAFLMYYKQWLQERKVDVPPHPWQAYRIAKSENDDDGDFIK